MIFFYIRYVDFSLFRQGEPVEFQQSIVDLTTWAAQTVDSLIKVEMPIDEIDFVPIDPTDKKSLLRVKRVTPLAGFVTMKKRHNKKVKKGH